MEDNKLLRQVKRLLPLIFIICAAATFFINRSLIMTRSYTASAVFEYKNENAEEGKTPTGEDLNVDEIKSSAIMSRVIDSLGLQGKYSVDNLISRITITEVPDEDKMTAKESKLDEGEETLYVPSTYIVAFTATNREGRDFAREVLDELLDTYFSYYSEKYINVDYLSNKISRIYDNNYDYLEMVEIIDESIDDTVEALYHRAEAKPFYRATGSEMSFNDIIEEFNYINNTKISSLFARIYKYQVTKNKQILLSNYTDRIDHNNISNDKERQTVSDVEQVINAYVDKMRESGNTDIDYNYILDEVYERDLRDGKGNPIANGEQTVTYDKLIYAWRDHTLNQDIANIDSIYSQYVIDTFSRCTGECGEGECAWSDKTCTQLHNEYYSDIEKEINDDIHEVVDKLTSLYKLTADTNNEYNEFLGCDNISVLSTVAVEPSVNVGVYSMIAFIFLMVVCCGGAVILGRTGDIIDKSFYTDAVTGFKNRAYFDKYLKKKDQVILDDGTVITSVRILNQREINDAVGRKDGDNVIKLFADQLRVVFAKTDALLVYNGNSHYVIISEKSDAITVGGIMQTFTHEIDNRQSLEDVEIKYSVGVAETFQSRVHSARRLLLEAVNTSAEYISRAVAKRDI